MHYFPLKPFFFLFFFFLHTANVVVIKSDGKPFWWLSKEDRLLGLALIYQQTLLHIYFPSEATFVCQEHNFDSN